VPEVMRKRHYSVKSLIAGCSSREKLGPLLRRAAQQPQNDDSSRAAAAFK
jgi:hypothetical protein